ncbi:hypothetical protein AB0F42_03560 [Streptomyces buecherae]|uniref:hypothetical protein n=1 Tax=Streptomyces buecherae TaxID=2763006 RepID=UPI0033DD147C
MKVGSRRLRVGHVWAGRAGERANERGGASREKKIEELDVQVDELALSLVGWQVENVRARLVTESFDGTRFQEIVVSGTARFLREDWTDRFSAYEDDDYPPTLLLGLSPVERPDAVSHTYALLERSRRPASGRCASPGPAAPGRPPSASGPSGSRSR